MPETLESSPQQQRRSMNVSEWPVARKVALVLAVPLLLAVALGGLRVQTELSKASAATATASQVTVLGPAVRYLSAAEDAALLYRDTENETRRTDALKSVNDAASELESAWTEADLSDAQRAQVRSLLDNTQGLRDGTAYAIISTASDQLRQLEAEVTLNIATMTETGSRTESLIGLVGQLNSGRLSVTEQQLLVIQRPEIIPKNELYGFLGVESAAIGSLELLLPEDASVRLLRQYNASNNGLLGIGTPDLKGTQPLRLYDELTGTLLGQIEGALSGEAAAANRTALLTAALTGLALLIAIALALVISRVLVGPIHSVRDGALSVAQEELPETVRRIRAGEDPGEITTIAVTTHEEMGQLARAVDDLHGTAVRLAQDEAELRSRVAEMFVTLSRRNTTLVNQQLHLIERLERDEEDPARLESLFRLDHLASRMRRTAESLVVLADAPTSHSEQDSLTIDEALQAATAGVQDYQRVHLSGTPPLRLSGVAAPDVVHLFTELVDNALAFSPPSSPVRVAASAPAGMVLVEVQDEGLGIDAETLAELNTTLRTGAEVTADAARRMGLFVVARLARRHGLTVTLERNAEGGTTARVFLPKPLLSSTGDDELPETGPDVEELSSAEVTALSESAFRRPEPWVALAVAPEPEREGLVLVEQEPALLDLGEDQPEVDDVEVEVEVEVEPIAETDPTTEPAAEQDVEPTQVARAAAPSGLDALSAVINANIRLPQREPGTAPQPMSISALLSQAGPEREPVEPEPVEAEPVEAVWTEPEPVEAAWVEPEPEPIESAWVEPEPEPEAEAVEVIEPEPLEPAWPASLESTVDVPETLSADELAVVGELPELLGVASTSALDSELPAYALDEHADEAETPLFRMLRSSWFTSAGGGWDPGEADEGWRAADRASDVAPSRLTRSGLPVRDPGNRLVPGGVAQAAPLLQRDPEAIRARLAAHAAGVARGRSSAAAEINHFVEPHENSEDVTH